MLPYHAKCKKLNVFAAGRARKVELEKTFFLLLMKMSFNSPFFFLGVVKFWYPGFKRRLKKLYFKMGFSCMKSSETCWKNMTTVLQPYLFFVEKLNSPIACYTNCIQNSKKNLNFDLKNSCLSSEWWFFFWIFFGVKEDFVNIIQNTCKSCSML